VRIVAPDLVEDAGAAEHLAGRGEQQLEELVFLGRQLDRVAVEEHLHRLAIDANVANFDNRRRLVREPARATPQRLKPGEQFLEVERLGQVVVGSAAQALDLVSGVIERGQHQDGRRHLRLAKLAADLAPTEAREHEDRKSTRLNSSHVKISYAVFCLKK